MAAAAQQGQDPARVGIVAATDVHSIPDRIVEVGAVARRVVLAAPTSGRPDRSRRRGAGRQVNQFLGLGHLALARLDQRQCEIGRAHLVDQLRCQRAVLAAGLGRSGERGEEALAVAFADRVRARHRHPLGGDPRLAKHPLDPAAARIGHNQDGGALLAGAAGSSRAMLQNFGVARHLDVDDEAERGDIDPARGDVGRDAHPRAAIAQRLQRVVALVLAVLARQSDGSEAALDERGVEVADIVARGAEQHRRFGLVKPQQVDHRMFDVGG